MQRKKKNNMKKEDIKKLQDTVDKVAKNTLHILEVMATKEDLTKTELKLQTQINGIESDLKSFKKDTHENFKKVNDKLDDLSDTVTSYDKRIEVLEGKV